MTLSEGVNVNVASIICHRRSKGRHGSLYRKAPRPVKGQIGDGLLLGRSRPLPVMRPSSGTVLGLLGGLGLLYCLRQNTFVQLGVLQSEVGWPLRLAGAALIALGAFLILAANERMIELSVLVSMFVAHMLFALVLLNSYLRDEFTGLNFLGQFFLIVIFILCLAGAVSPLRYFQAEYRPY